LIELLAVVLIAGILAAMSVPAFHAIVKGSALKNAAKGLTDTFAYARQLAITNRHLYHVELRDHQLNSSELQDKVDNALQVQSYRIYYEDRRGRKVTFGKWHPLPDFVEFDRDPRPPAEVVFQPTGGAFAYTQNGQHDTRFEFRFRVLHTESGTDNEEKAMTIRVNRTTGAAKSEAG
jgi:Tfp pilus assembly protein FimT